LEEEIASLRGKLSQARAQELGQVEVRRRVMEKEAQAMMPPPPVQPPKHPVRIRDVVWVERLKSEGSVMEIDGDEAQVQAGRLRLRLRLDELEWRSTPQPEADAPVQGIARAASPSPGMELDLRGERADDALARLDKHLDEAYLAGLPWVRVIHGHGTGALKKAVRGTLRGHPLVIDFESGKDGEGGDGVTVVKLAQGS
jgi:DNA mismatch repair protein MutS2